MTCDRLVVSSRFSTNKTDHHDITEILSKVALKNINQSTYIFKVRQTLQIIRVRFSRFVFDSPCHIYLKHKFYTYSWDIMRDHILHDYTISLSYWGNTPHHIHLIIYLTWVLYHEIYHISWSWKQLYSVYLLIYLKQTS